MARARKTREQEAPALQLPWKKVQSWLLSFRCKILISIMINIQTKVYVFALYTIVVLYIRTVPYRTAPHRIFVFNNLALSRHRVGSAHARAKKNFSSADLVVH